MHKIWGRDILHYKYYPKTMPPCPSDVGVKVPLFIYIRIYVYVPTLTPYSRKPCPTTLLPVAVLPVVFSENLMHINSYERTHSSPFPKARQKRKSCFAYTSTKQHFNPFNFFFLLICLNFYVRM